MIQKRANGISLASVVLGYIKASGPVSFAGILHEVKVQYPGTAEPFEVADQLTKLIRNHRVKLYDDGISFDTE